MREIFFDVLEINIAVSVIFFMLFLLSGKLRKRYGAGWMKLAWILLTVRLLILYNFSLPGTEIRLFRFTDVSAETEDSEQKENHTVNVAPINGMQPDVENMTGNSSGANDAEVYGDGASGTAGAFDAFKADNIIEISPTASDAGVADRNKSEGNRQGENAVWRRMIFGGGILPLIWIIGVGASFVYCLIGYICFQLHCRKNLCPVTDINLRKQIIGLERKLNGRANIPCYQDWKGTSPMLTGIFLPKLILPGDKKNWTETELELACDASVLAGYDEKMWEDYARIMLSFAGKKGNVPALTTGFGESKKQMKRRIDSMLDAGKKKKGIISIVMTCVLILGMGLLISCGNKPEEESAVREQDMGEKIEESNSVQGDVLGTDAAGQGDMGTDVLLQGEMAQSASDGSVVASYSHLLGEVRLTVGSGSEERVISYSLNNEYNEMIRCYGGNIYIAREDGIYRLSDDEASEELLFANDYRMRRGMELYQDYLYFCGSAKRGEQDAATIYRMDLNSHEVKDALGLFSQVFGGFYNITIYEGKLYAADVYNVRSGFELDENGEIVKMLDAESDDFLYKEDNEYWKLQSKIWNNEVVFDTEEYWDTVNQMSGMYRNIIDTAACERMLGGNQVVLKYKNELLSGIYLKKEEGDYEYLCDTISYPVLVTETGVYYFPDESFAIWYVDYETKTRQKLWEKESDELADIQLANYDQYYVYFTKSVQAGLDQEGMVVYENYLMRVPRWQEGEAEEVYRFELDRNLGSLYRRCAVVGGRMFFDGQETISM